MNTRTPPTTDQPLVRSEIEHELHSMLANGREVAQAYGDEFENLWALAARYITGGKLIRPVLMVETWAALISAAPHTQIPNCAIRSTILRLAGSLELLHYSFLLHDDVIDGDLLRRGKPNLIGALLAQQLTQNERITYADEPRTTALHWARTGGILMGDLLLAATHQQFARADVDHATRLRMLDLLEHTILESVAGEQLDVGLSDGVIAPDLNTILTMTAKKTATYTFEMPMRLAAILAGSNPEIERALTAAGYHLGVAFQLQDDLLSTFGDPQFHGKDLFSDLREGKQTAVIAYARMTNTWPSIEPHFGDPALTPEIGANMRALLVSCGAERFVTGLIDEQMTALYQLLASSPGAAQLPPSVRTVLLQFASELEGRRS